MSRNYKSQYARVALGTTLAFLFTAGTSAYAEGGDKRPGGSWGVNRRIRTVAGGYVEIRGTFTNMSWHLTEDPDWVAHKDPNYITSQPYTNRSNPCGSKPTAYFGSSGTVETDLGLQVEWQTRRINNVLYKPGWSVFMNFDGATSMRIPHLAEDGAVEWRAWRGYASDYTMHYKVWTQRGEVPVTVSSYNNETQKWESKIEKFPVEQGAVSLKLDGIGEVFADPITPTKDPAGQREKTRVEQPDMQYAPKTAQRRPSIVQLTSNTTPTAPQLTLPESGIPALYPYRGPGKDAPLGLIPKEKFNGIIAKRVVGITQVGGWRGETDGSSFTSTFSGGQLRKSGRQTLEQWKNTDPQSSATHIINHEGLGATGYDTPTGGNDAKDLMWGLPIPIPVKRLQPPIKTDADDFPTPEWKDYKIKLSMPGASFKVAFPNLKLPDGSPASDIARKAYSAESPNTEKLLENGNSRYAEETVVISLKNAARPWGYKITPKVETISGQ